MNVAVAGGGNIIDESVTLTRRRGFRLEPFLASHPLFVFWQNFMLLISLFAVYVTPARRAPASPTRPPARLL